MPLEQKRKMISKGHLEMSIVQQCEALGIHRSGYYYEPRQECDLNLQLMRLMDEHYLEHPYKGAPQMYRWLKYDKGFDINHKRIDRLYYDVMGLTSLQPGKHTTRKNKAHKVFPYLLRGLKIIKANQVWQIDITYIPMLNGFMYLVAIIDVYSRYIVNWSLSNSMDMHWVCDCMKEAFAINCRPQIVNMDFPTIVYT